MCDMEIQLLLVREKWQFSTRVHTLQHAGKDMNLSCSFEPFSHN